MNNINLGNNKPLVHSAKEIGCVRANYCRLPRLLAIGLADAIWFRVNGKKRGEVTVARGAQNPEIEAAVLGLDAVKQSLGGKTVRKVIIVPMRIVNVVG